MKKIFAVILLATMSCQLSAQSINETAAIKVLEEKYSVLLDKQANTEYNLRKLKNSQKEIEHKMQTLGSENLRQGEMIDSLQFAEILSKNSQISFFIGGAYGLSENFKQKMDKIISLTKLTLAHKIAKLMLFEQIFRGLCINAGHPYHK